MTDFDHDDPRDQKVLLFAIQLVHNQYNSHLRTMMALDAERPEQFFRRLEKRQYYPVKNVIGPPNREHESPRSSAATWGSSQRLTSQARSALDDNRHRVSLPSIYTIVIFRRTCSRSSGLCSVRDHTLTLFARISGGGYLSLFYAVSGVP